MFKHKVAQRSPKGTQRTFSTAPILKNLSLNNHSLTMKKHSLLPDELIINKIILLQDQKVLLDRDLA